METRKILFEKFEDVLTMEHTAPQTYEECLRLTEHGGLSSEWFDWQLISGTVL